MIRFKATDAAGKAAEKSAAKAAKVEAPAEDDFVEAQASIGGKSFGKSKTGAKAGPLSKAGRAARKGPAKA